MLCVLCIRDIIFMKKIIDFENEMETWDRECLEVLVSCMSEGKWINKNKEKSQETSKNENESEHQRSHMGWSVHLCSCFCAYRV